MRSHLFPCRTQKLSSSSLKILGGRPPGKISCRRHKAQNTLRSVLVYAPLAQMVEQLTLNQWVLGSSPRWCTKNAENQRLRPVGQAVKTPASHAGDGSSILPRVIHLPRPQADTFQFAFFCTWTISSVGQSNRLITGGSGVRVPDGPLSS